MKSSIKRKSYSSLVGWGFIAFFIVSYIFATMEGHTFLTLSSQALIELGANYAPLTWNGQEWRLVTYIFLHANLFHLLVNSLALWAVWKRSAMVFPTWTQVYIFISCGFISGWIGAAHQLDTVSTGSSGAILGLLSAVVSWGIARPYIKKNVIQSIVQLPLIIIIAILIASFFLPGLDFYSNAGGIFGGVCFGFFLNSKAEKEENIVSGLLIAVAITIALLCCLFLFSRPNEAQMQQNQRQKIAQQTLSYIHDADKKIEAQMNSLWELQEKEPNEKIWEDKWRTEIIKPLENHVEMLTNAKSLPSDYYHQHLLILKEYSLTRLQEAKLLELHRDEEETLIAIKKLRARMVELNSKMAALEVEDISANKIP